MSDRSSKRRLWWVKMMWVWCIVILYVSLLLTLMVDVENIVGTGPALLGLGLGMFGLSLHIRFAWGWMMGASHVLLCILIAIWISYGQVSPHEATEPVAIITMLYSAGATIFSWFGLRWRLPPQSPWLCRGCDYMLFGLDRSGNCPECGMGYEIADNVKEPSEKALTTFSQQR
ncbi:hypothetical protein JD969_01475 [Planctomycetota bacterium]|nr:hypothetical protein JD969_01475 [Planctomycetota bacterium]